MTKTNKCSIIEHVIKKPCGSNGAATPPHRAQTKLIDSSLMVKLRLYDFILLKMEKIVKYFISFPLSNNRIWKGCV
nr:MAG TPA: hypothetical protein [Bacteriophage sp.]